MSDAMAGEFNRLIQYLQGRQTELAENADESVSKHAGFIVMLAAIATGEVNARAVPDLAAQDVGSWAGHMADLANGRWVNPARA
jgi:hypothetical protein